MKCRCFDHFNQNRIINPLKFPVEENFFAEVHIFSKFSFRAKYIVLHLQRSIAQKKLFPTWENYYKCAGCPINKYGTQDTT